MAKKTTKDITTKAKDRAENTGRRRLLEELFYDISRSQVQIYWINFNRGIFFGVGTALGGTVVIALIVWFLNQFTDVFPAVQEIVDTINNR